MLTFDLLRSNFKGFTFAIALTFMLLSGFGQRLMANGIAISNVTITNHDASNEMVQIHFDVSWENSWRHPIQSGFPNWDAAWIFGRFRLRGDQSWMPMVLVKGGSTSGVGTESTVDIKSHPSIAPNGIGAMIYRVEDGSGLFTASNVTFTWYYGANKPGINDVDLLEIRLFGIEMVYVPGGPFYLGDGATGFYEANSGSNITPYRIESLGPINTGGNAELAYAAPAGFPTYQPTIPIEHPSGVHPFYIMKHEWTEQMFVNYLNTSPSILNQQIFDSLDQAQQQNQIANALSVVVVDGEFEYLTVNPNRPINYLAWQEIAALADWSGMRPMSEFEYEKSSKGWNFPVQNMYPWGKKGIISDFYSITNGRVSGGYSPNSTNGNAAYNETIPTSHVELEVGSFANDSSSRSQASAAVTGVLDLAGNVEERVASFGVANLTSWVHVHGDGLLVPSSLSNEQWPGYDNELGYIPNGAGQTGKRGGGVKSSKERLRVSDRYNMFYADDFGGGVSSNWEKRTLGSGGRAVLTRECTLPLFTSANYDISGSYLTNNIFEVNLSSLAVEQEFIWILEATGGQAKIIEGQGTDAIKLFVSEGIGSFKVYVHSVNDCGISVNSLHLEVSD